MDLVKHVAQDKELLILFEHQGPLVFRSTWREIKEAISITDKTELRVWAIDWVVRLISGLVIDESPWYVTTSMCCGKFNIKVAVPAYKEFPKTLWSLSWM